MGPYICVYCSVALMMRASSTERSVPCMYELAIISFISSLTTYDRFCITLIIWIEKLRKTEVRNLDKVIDT